MSEHPTNPEPTRPDYNPMDETMNEKHERPDDTTVLGEPTRAVPEPPFRVDPATPVPDDVVTAEPAAPTAPAGPPAPDPATRQPDPAPYRA
ncbi:MAG: hypothetical protein L0H79_18520, partial [Intrasporangium sp.]|nr:hypothetical protein [Intrasporangium sp.]